MDFNLRIKYNCTVIDRDEDIQCVHIIVRCIFLFVVKNKLVYLKNKN